MSNSRMFCVAFAVCNGIFAIADMFGVPHTYDGLAHMFGKFLCCVIIAISFVAFLGDRDRKAK